MDNAEIKSGRINFLFLIFTLFTLAVLVRMYDLQITKHSAYAALAENQRSFSDTLFPERGQIYINDKNSFAFGEKGDSYFPVAINRPGYTIYAVPKEIKNPSDTANELEKILGLPSKELYEHLAKPNDSYEVLARKMDEKDVEKIRDSKLAGIKFEAEKWRFWPEGNLMSQVLGFVGYSSTEDKREGQYGIEGYFDKELEGKQGLIDTERDTGGKWISLGMKKYIPAENGVDLILTIDRAIQYKVEQELEQAAKGVKAVSAQAIVMDPATGKILAMANWPGFDPNAYSAVESFDVFLNKTMQSRYEPGSVIKPFTLAIALNEGKITPNSKYEDKGLLMIDGWPINNSENKKYGVQTMTEVLEKSLNTGAVFASQQVSKDIFYNYFKNFGFDVPTGIELQGEINGDLKNLETKRNVAYANASFGQGIAITPLELAAAFSSLINGGKLMRPYIIEAVIKKGGEKEVYQSETIRQIITPETSAKITAMLVSVVEKGHAKQAAVPGYWIGGKTGTAQIPFKNKKGYSDKTDHTFIGFGSAPDPKFVVLVKFDEPEAKFAEATTVPVFNSIAKFLLSYLEIPPNRK